MDGRVVGSSYRGVWVVCQCTFYSDAFLAYWKLCPWEFAWKQFRKKVVPSNGIKVPHVLYNITLQGGWKSNTVHLSSFLHQVLNRSTYVAFLYGSRNRKPVNWWVCLFICIFPNWVSLEQHIQKRINMNSWGRWCWVFFMINSFCIAEDIFSCLWAFQSCDLRPAVLPCQKHVRELLIF